MRFNNSLSVYTLKEFNKVLNEKGFYFHHRNAAHLVYANIDGYFVTVPVKKKEINAMMTTVCLQRINNHQCRMLDRYTIDRYKDDYYAESGQYINRKG